MDTTRTDVANSGATWFLVILARAGIHTWSDVAALCAAVYSCLLIVNWLWRVWRHLRGDEL